LAEGGSVEYIEIQVSSLQNERDIMIFCDRYIRAFKGEIIDFCTFIEMPPERTKDFIAILAVFAVKKIQQIVSRALEQKVRDESASKREKFEKRGQILPRERVARLLDPDSEIRYIIEHKRVMVLKEELNTVPKFFYFYAT